MEALPPAHLRRILLARPRGFCAGVKRAIETVEWALRHLPTPVYVYHEIVHNTHVVRSLEHRGTRFVEEIEEIPDGGVVIFSAHGVSPQIRLQASAKGLRIIDATCPLVTKVHREARHFARQGRTILLVGHRGHQEVIGTMGEAPGHIRLVIAPEDVQRVDVPDPSKVAVITQTTLSLDETEGIMEAIRERFPKAAQPAKEDICYATTNRQKAVKAIASSADLILVLGSRNSSNSRRLAEVARALGTPAHLIDDVHELDPTWLDGVKTLGITAGASAPEHLVTEAVEVLSRGGDVKIEEVAAVKEERVHFGLPSELKRWPSSPDG
jgi:4-hydroxy-3-methylbut-2-enyl diphosphate reductase